MYFAKQARRGDIYKMFSTWVRDSKMTSLIINVIKNGAPILKLESLNTLCPHNA